MLKFCVDRVEVDLIGICCSNPNYNAICSFSDKKYKEILCAVFFLYLMFTLLSILVFSILLSLSNFSFCFSSTFNCDIKLVHYSIEYNIVDYSSSSM